MIHIKLSDHAADILKQKDDEREARYQGAVGCYNEALQVRLAKITQHKSNVAIAWREKKIGRLIISLVSLLLSKLSPAPPRPKIEGYSQEEFIYASGKVGEDKVIRYMADRLDDAWTLFTGYENYRGEIDGVLVGPKGLFSIEVKNINGVVSCQGDEWHRDKYDKYGNLVERSVPITDRKGRGPSQQLNEATDVLQRQLQKRITDCNIYRLVLLTHLKSRIGEIWNSTVDEVTTIDLWSIEHTLRRGKIAMDQAQCEKVIAAIRSDHEYHERKRREHRQRQADAQGLQGRAV